MLAFRDEFLEKFFDSFVESFCEAISGWVVCRSGHTLDSELVAEPLKSLADELGPIVMNDPSWHTNVRCLYLS